MARAAARYDVTDLRWFNLRDSGPDATGFGERSGLLTAGYRRKPAFGTYRALIARYGAQAARRANARPRRPPPGHPGATPAPTGQISSPAVDVGASN